MSKPADTNAAVAQFDTSNWVDEQVGFSPYWNPDNDKFFIGAVSARDERDPEFIRYLIKAAVDTECKRGSDENAEDVLVKAGEFFTVSVYYSLRDLFDFYLESGLRPFIKVTALKEVKTKNKNTCWTWRVQISPKDKAVVEKKRIELTAAKEAARLAEQNDAFPPA